MSDPFATGPATTRPPFHGDDQDARPVSTCAACTSVVPYDSRFCPTCGAPASDLDGFDPEAAENQAPSGYLGSGLPSAVPTWSPDDEPAGRPYDRGDDGFGDFTGAFGERPDPWDQADHGVDAVPPRSAWADGTGFESPTPSSGTGGGWAAGPRPGAYGSTDYGAGQYAPPPAGWADQRYAYPQEPAARHHRQEPAAEPPPGMVPSAGPAAPAGPPATMADPGVTADPGGTTDPGVTADPGQPVLTGPSGRFGPPGGAPGAAAWPPAPADDRTAEPAREDPGTQPPLPGPFRSAPGPERRDDATATFAPQGAVPPWQPSAAAREPYAGPPATGPASAGGRARLHEPVPGLAAGPGADPWADPWADPTLGTGAAPDAERTRDAGYAGDAADAERTQAPTAAFPSSFGSPVASPFAAPPTRTDDGPGDSTGDSTDDGPGDSDEPTGPVYGRFPAPAGSGPAVVPAADPPVTYADQRDHDSGPIPFAPGPEPVANPYAHGYEQYGGPPPDREAGTVPQARVHGGPPGPPGQQYGQQEYGPQAGYGPAYDDRRAPGWAAAPGPYGGGGGGGGNGGGGDGGGDDGAIRFDDRADRMAEERRWRTVALVGGAVLLVVALLIGGGLFLFHGRDDQVPQANSSTGAAASASASDSPSASASPSPAGDARTQAAAVDAVLGRAVKGKTLLATAYGQASNCSISPAAAEGKFREAAANRRGIVRSAKKLDVSALQGGARVQRLIVSTYSTSARADQAFADWAAAGKGQRCLKATATRQRGNTLSVRAGSLKRTLAKAWNPLAKRYDLPSRTKDSL